VFSSTLKLNRTGNRPDAVNTVPGGIGKYEVSNFGVAFNGKIYRVWRAATLSKTDQPTISRNLFLAVQTLGDTPFKALRQPDSLI